MDYINNLEKYIDVFNFIVNFQPAELLDKLNRYHFIGLSAFVFFVKNPFELMFFMINSIHFLNTTILKFIKILINKMVTIAHSIILYYELSWIKAKAKQKVIQNQKKEEYHELDESIFSKTLEMNSDDSELGNNRVCHVKIKDESENGISFCFFFDYFFI